MQAEAFNLPMYLALLLAAAAATMTVPRDAAAHYRAVGAFVVHAVLEEGEAEASFSDGGP